MMEIARAEKYEMLTRSRCLDIEGVDDAKKFKELKSAMRVIGMTGKFQDISNNGPLGAEMQFVFSIISSILHFGNIQFVPVGSDHAALADDESNQFAVAKLLG
jgi:myosin-1